jgi:hypothetical protein
MAFPRGISPELLVSQVKNTMPYVFEDASWARFEPALVVRAEDAEPGRALDHFDYFRLCLSSHYLTCGTPVPTDVDNEIRRKLWPAGLPLDVAFRMTDLVLASRKWDSTRVSSRFVRGAKGTPWENEVLAGHLGEWFTVAAAAYAALGKYSGPAAAAKKAEVDAAITDEVHRHSEIFGSLWRAGDGLGSLKAAASIAHNFGDLDRVMDMWELAPADPLRLRFHKLTAQPFDAERKLRYLGRLWVAGELYKSPIAGSSLALENHRHFALRKPRPLRERAELVVPTAPFFDVWGRAVGRAFAGEKEKALEIFEALAAGWERQPGTVAYGRGILGMIEVLPELARSAALEPLRKDKLRKRVLDQSQAAFESQWAGEALRWMDEIPSRAS